MRVCAAVDIRVRATVRKSGRGSNCGKSRGDWRTAVYGPFSMLVLRVRNQLLVGSRCNQRVATRLLVSGSSRGVRSRS